MSETGPLRPSQKLILEDWFSNKKNNKNNIIKLHTGEGKTLIGLLLLQSRINSDSGACVFVCPNKYLAEQVKLEAKKFGIPFCDFSSGPDLPDEFVSGKKLLITHVQKVFNGKTVFGINGRSTEVDTIIMDDSHACIDSIKSSLTIKVEKNHPLYFELFTIFESELTEQGHGSFLEIKSGEFNTMLPVPYWSWSDKKEEVINKILSHKTDTEISFVWPVIKDHIVNCQCFISGSYLEITPYLMPIEAFGSFSKANHRILMSATTQDDSFFIKGLGFDIDSITNPLSNKELKWSGEKMILMPSLIDDELQRDQVISELLSPKDDSGFGVVSLTPSFSRKRQYESIGANFATSNDIFESVQKLKSGDYNKAMVFANRYDGIDLPDNTCRVLVIDSKPYFDSLSDRYEEDCRANSDILNIRIAQKIEQGLGRSVRGEKDYSVVVLVGGDLIKFVKSPLTSKYFSPQTRKQIEIGMQLAEYAIEDAEDQSPLKLLTNLMYQAIDRDEGWKEYYTEEMEGLGDESGSDKIHEYLKMEYEAERFCFIGEYGKACKIAQNLCDSSDNDSNEKGWYLQMLARYLYYTSRSESNKIQKTAFQKNLQLLKPREGIDYKKLEFINENRVSRIKDWMESHKSYENMMIALDGMTQDLSFGMPSEKFELALQELGNALGFLSQRPDKEIKKGPDNLWCGVDDFYFILECKNEVVDDRAEISKHEAGQMNSHSAWFEKTYNTPNCKRILIIPTKKLSYHGDFSHTVEVMRKGSLKKLKDNTKKFFKEFSAYDINELGDEIIQRFINANELDLESLKTKYTEVHITAGT